MAQIIDTFPGFLGDDAVMVAQRLLGCRLIRWLGGKEVELKIVETEAYDQRDAASHSFNGHTPRTDAMFGPSGNLYVYFTYGMHYCCNVVTGQRNEGSAVLIRAVEPLNNQELLESRSGKIGIEVTNGPAKLCKTLGIDKMLNGHDLRYEPLRLALGEAIDPVDMIITTRVGITKARDELRRFYIRGNPYVSQRMIKQEEVAV